ncbi:MAG: ExeM/NucH family extracellular endonuclease, partial [Pseudomonadota bacterium]
MIKLFNSAIVSYNMTQDLLGFSTPVFTIEDGLPASSTFTPSLSDARDAAPVPQFAPTTLFQESFETDGNGTRYTSSSEFNDGISDHFQRTDGSTISNVTAGYSNIDGSFFIAGEDLDDGGGDGVDEKYITFNPINIAGQSNIDITAAFGAGNEGPLNASNYDALDWMGLFYRVDGGAWQIGVLFNADPNGADAFNDPLRQVDLSTISYAGGNTEASAVTGLLAGTDYTALIASGGTSTTLATALQDFTIDLGTQTGTSLEIVFGAHMDSGSEEIAFDNLRVTSEAGSSDTTPPTLVSTGPADDGTLNDTAADLTLTFDENIQLGTGNITIFNAADDTVFETFDVATSAAVTVSGSTVTINPTGTFTLTNGYYVQVAGTAITDTAGNAFAGISDETTFNFDVQALTIGAIQGTTDTSGFVGQTVTISAIVTGDHQTGTGEDGDLEGFFMQDGGDGNALTSDGIFVYDGNTTLAVDVSKGDRVSVTGIVSERFGKTVIDVSQGGSVTITNAGEVTDITTLITTIDMSTIGARTAGGDYRADFEAYESMLVDFQQTLTVTEVRDLDDFGEFLVSADGIPLSFTQQANNADINAVNFDAYLQQAGSQMFLIDDGQNGVGNPIIWPDGSLGTDDGFRNGSTIADAFGIMDFGFSNFRLQVVDTDNDNDITDEITIDTTANARPMSVGVDGELVIASVNVENFFSTLGSRGAQTAAELARQTDKVVEGLAAIDADIFGLQEIENDFNFDGTSALEVLVNALNAKVGAGTYAFVDPGVTAIGSDAIATAFIYKVGTVEVTSGTSTAILSDTDLAGLGITDLGDLGSVFNGSSTNRNPLAVSFTELATGHSFTAVNNHLKSKGGTGTGANADQNDGVASFNEVRLIGLQAIDAWLATNPTGLNDADNIIIGDLNAYAMEDPINYLVTNGYVDLNMSAVGSSDYGYWFDAFAGTLDYGIANAALAAQAV